MYVSFIVVYVELEGLVVEMKRWMISIPTRLERRTRTTRTMHSAIGHAVLLLMSVCISVLICGFSLPVCGFVKTFD